VSPRRRASLLRRAAWAAVLVVLLGLAGWRAAAHWLSTPYQGWAGEAVSVEIQPGWSGQRIFTELAAAGVLRDPLVARAVHRFALGSPALHAGEYEFRRADTVRGVLERLARGDVVTYPLTVIEGLTLDETVETIAAAGFGNLADLRQAVYDPALVRDLDPAARELEGYLYPETYRFARGTASREIVATMVNMFRTRFAAEVAPLLAPGVSPRELVILASIVEKEASLDHERPLVAAVYRNRLDRGIGLYADPTIIYALKRLGRWDGNLRRADLAMDSPYNTYRVAGLPPGPICSPGVAAMRAAARPADVPYLYFVSRNDGSHVFATTLAEHNRNVEQWQRRYWRERWAAEGGRR
jgi:UPF0755 protein